MLNPHRLRILLELKHRGTIAEVAAALSYSPSAISQQLAALSAEVQAPLLEPAGRRVRLTSHAEILVAHATPLLQQIELAEAELAESLAGLRGTVRLATFQTAFLGLVPRLLDLMSDRPHVSLEIVHVQPDTGFDALASYDCDLLIAEEYPGVPWPRSPEVDCVDLFRDPLRLLVPDPWQDRSARGALKALRDAPWVMEPRGNAARAWATALCREAGFEPDVRFESPDLLVQIRLVEIGRAVAVVPDLVWSTIDPPARLLPLATRPTRRVFTAVRAGAATHPLIALVRRRLEDVVAALPSLTS